MAIHTEKVFFEGEQGPIECAIDWPDVPIRGWALCLHPHPLHEGTNTNKVVTTISRTCNQQGLVTLRPNFRGVGASAGEFDHSQGETVDMMLLLEQFSVNFPDIAQMPWVLSGFSFGTAVATQLYMERQDRHLVLPIQMILAGPAAWRFLYREVELPENVLIVHGEKDDVVPLQEAFDWLAPMNLPITVVPSAGHFFHGKLVLLKKVVLSALEKM